MKEKPYKLICGKDEIVLSPSWKYHVGAEMPSAPASTNFHYVPVGLYNGMIAPLEKLHVLKESFGIRENRMLEKWQEYSSLLTALMKDWRKLFQNDKLPFLYC